MALKMNINNYLSLCSLRAAQGLQLRQEFLSAPAVPCCYQDFHLAPQYVLDTSSATPQCRLDCGLEKGECISDHPRMDPYSTRYGVWSHPCCHVRGLDILTPDISAPSQANVTAVPSGSATNGGSHRENPSEIDPLLHRKHVLLVPGVSSPAYLRHKQRDLQRLEASVHVACRLLRLVKQLAAFMPCPDHWRLSQQPLIMPQ